MGTTGTRRREDATVPNAGADLVGEGQALVAAAARSGAAVIEYSLSRDSLTIWFAQDGDLTVFRSGVGRDSLGSTD